jgi:hypothetical protein
MEQFSLEKYLENPTRKVVTRDGREVDIVKYDMKGTHFPILYVISNEDGSQEPCYCSKSGMCQFDNTQSSTDLFFADEEEELTEFEKSIQYVLGCYACKQIELGDKADNIKLYAETLLDLARKEIEKEFKDEEYFRLITEHYKQGKQDALKSLPKWKDVSGKNGAGTKDYKIVGYYLVKGNYALYLEDLDKLPKKE